MVKGRTTLPALACVKLSAANGRLVIAATNLDSWCIRIIDCEGDLGPILVKHELLSSISETIIEGDVNIAMDGSRLVFARSKLNTMAASEFPSSPDISKSKVIGVNADDLADGLEAVNWAAAKDANLEDFKLTTVVDLQPKSITCVATTGKVLALFKRPLICETRKIVLPSAAANVLLQDLREKDAKITLSDNMIRVSNENGESIIKLSEAKAFPYEGVVANKDGLQGTVLPRDLLRRVCRRTSALTGIDKNPILSVKRDGDNVSLWSAGQEGEDMETIHAPGGDLEMHMNAELLDGCLQKIKDETVNVFTNINAAFIESWEMLFGLAQMVDPKKK